MKVWIKAIDMNSAQLILSAQRAMLFNMSPKFRMISIEVSKNQILIMLVISSSELSDDEKDLISSIIGEIEGDFCEIKSSEVNFIIDNGDIDNLRRLDTLIYALYK